MSRDDPARAPSPGRDEKVPFGARDVPASEKSDLVRALFAGVAARYDLMNDLMSVGVHRLWKRRMVEALGPAPPGRVLDLAGGTGDVANRILDHYEIETECAVIVCDASRAMIETGRERAWNRGRVKGLAWLCAEAEALPLPSAAFDACTIAFGLRNLTRIEPALGEIRRVLKPGGRFLCLEFTPDVAPALRAAYDLYSDRVIPAIGAIVTGEGDAYRYLVESIRRFPTADRLSELIVEAGFAGVRARRLSAGVAALHSAWRI